MKQNKVLEKIRMIIYNHKEGNLNKEQAFDKIRCIMELHQAEKMKRRE